MAGELGTEIVTDFGRRPARASVAAPERRQEDEDKLKPIKRGNRASESGDTGRLLA